MTTSMACVLHLSACGFQVSPGLDMGCPMHDGYDGGASAVENVNKLWQHCSVVNTFSTAESLL